jgi:RNA polymerase-binding transcription factor DksA
VPASRPAAAKAAASATKKSRAGAATPAKKSPPSTKKAAPSVHKAVTPSRKTAPAKKAAPPVKKAATAAKKAAPPAKKAAPAAKKAAPAGARSAKKTAPAAAAAAKKATAAVAPVAVVAPRTTFTPKPKPPAPVKPKTGPYAKDAKFLEEVTELLVADRAIYQEQATSLRAEADSLALEREPGDVQFDEESGEGGTVTVDRERNLALSGQASLAVEEIDYALERIADKTYGYCERCFQPIPKPRLRALPYARLCVACKSGGLSRR